MNAQQQLHLDYFLERRAHWRTLRDDETACRLLAARDADEKYPIRTEEEMDEILTVLYPDEVRR